MLKKLAYISIVPTIIPSEQYFTPGYTSDPINLFHLKGSYNTSLERQLDKKENHYPMQKKLS